MKIGLKIVAVCIVFGVCFAIGGTLAGVAKLAPKETTEGAQPNILRPFAVFCLSVGSTVSYLILRSSWRGWKLAAVLFAAAYGISTIATQVETTFFLSAKMPRGMIAALFTQGAIAMALFAPLAVLILGRWRPAPAASENREAPPLPAVAMTWRVALLVASFVFLYFLFGYYVAWRNPELRAFYGGADFLSFFDSLKSNWQNRPLLILLQVLRALLYVACVYPLLRMLRGARWQRATATALFLASWTTALLLPNPLMPASVARSHLWETLGFNLIFGAMMGFLLIKTRPRAQSAISR